MDYITYKRYKGSGIGGYFNIRHGTKVTENGGFLHAPDGRGICAVTSEDGWEHFRPDTPEGAYQDTRRYQQLQLADSSPPSSGASVSMALLHTGILPPPR